MDNRWVTLVLLLDWCCVKLRGESLRFFPYLATVSLYFWCSSGTITTREWLSPVVVVRVHHSAYPSTLSLYSAEWLSGCVVAAVWKAAGPVSSVQCGTMRESATRTTTGVLRQFAAAFSGIHKQYKYSTSCILNKWNLLCPPVYLWKH